MSKVFVLFSLTIVSLLHVGCTSNSNASIKSEINKDVISIDAVVNMARTSYMKGCVQGKNHYGNPKTKALKMCKDLAQKHVIGLRAFLESAPK